MRIKIFIKAIVCLIKLAIPMMSYMYFIDLVLKIEAILLKYLSRVPTRVCLILLNLFILIVMRSVINDILDKCLKEDK